MVIRHNIKIIISISNNCNIVAYMSMWVGSKLKVTCMCWCVGCPFINLLNTTVYFLVSCCLPLKGHVFGCYYFPVFNDFMPHVIVPRIYFQGLLLSWEGAPGMRQCFHHLFRNVTAAFVNESDVNEHWSGLGWLSQHVIGPWQTTVLNHYPNQLNRLTSLDESKCKLK